MAAPAAPSAGWSPKDPKLPNELSQKLLVALRVSQKSQVQNRRATPPLVDPATTSNAPSVSSTPANSAAPQQSVVGVGKRAFAVGDVAYYWSTTHRTWLKSRVMSLNMDAAGVTLTYNLDCKSKVESWQMRQIEEPRDGPPDVSEGAGGGFTVGMPVQCFNQVQKLWEEGIVVRRYQHEKIIVFDVDCKGHQLRMLPAGRLRLSRFAVGDTVEYWSNTSKSWVPAQVVRLSWAKRTCDLDIKRGAFLSNVRKVQAPGEAETPQIGGAGPQAVAAGAGPDARTGAPPVVAASSQRVAASATREARPERPVEPAERQSRSRSRQKDKGKDASITAVPPDQMTSARQVEKDEPAANSRLELEPATSISDLQESRRLRESRLLRNGRARDVRDFPARPEMPADVRDVRDPPTVC